jgi:hypothetical protein
MKLKCIKNWVEYENGDIKDLSTYLTIGKIYYLSGNPPCSEWVYNIIDDLYVPHDMSKDMFIDFTQQEREEKLNQLGI